MTSPPPPPPPGFCLSKPRGGKRRQWLLAVLTLVCTLLAATRSPSAAPPPAPNLAYKGFYVLVDPYDNNNGTGDGIPLLKAAANQKCNGNAPASTSNNYAFCGYSNGLPFVSGIFLTIHWCNWELDSSETSCLPESNQDGSAQSLAEATSPCWNAAGGSQYDECNVTPPISDCSTSDPPTSESTLAQALYWVCEINVQRAANTTATGAAAPLAPLRITLALEAGIYTPASVQADGVVDVPVAIKSNGTFTYRCGHEPQVWLSQYQASYNGAFSALVNFVGSAVTYTSGSLVTIATVGGINENTAEIVSTGTALAQAGSPWATPPAGQPNCVYENATTGTPPGTNTSSAAQLLSIYSTQVPPGTGPNLAQALENTFGTLTGATFQTMYQAATAAIVANQFQVSVNTRNSQAWPEIQCGVTANTEPCAPDSPSLSSDQWPALFLFNAVKDLTTTTGSGATAAAFADFANYFTVSRLLVDSTNLAAATEQILLPGPGQESAPVNSPTQNTFNTDCQAGATSCPKLALMQLTCNLNNKLSSNTGTFREGWDYNSTPNGPYLTMPKGIASVIGFQTDPSTATINLCGNSQKASVYGSEILQFGLNNGAQILEVSPLEATNGYCQPDLATYLAMLPEQSNCDYTAQ